MFNGSKGDSIDSKPYLLDNVDFSLFYWSLGKSLVEFISSLLRIILLLVVFLLFTIELLWLFWLLFLFIFMTGSLLKYYCLISSENIIGFSAFRMGIY